MVTTVTLHILHCLLCIVYPVSRSTRKGVLHVNVLYSILRDPLDVCIPAFRYKTYRMFKQKNKEIHTHLFQRLM